MITGHLSEGGNLRVHRAALGRGADRCDRPGPVHAVLIERIAVVQPGGATLSLEITRVRRGMRGGSQLAEIADVDALERRPVTATTAGLARLREHAGRIEKCAAGRGVGEGGGLRQVSTIVACLI